MYTALLLISILLSACFMVFGEEVFADGHNFCCKEYLNRKKCRNSANYDCIWLDRKDAEGNPSDRDIFRQYGAQCLGKRFVKCKREYGLRYKCFDGCGDECEEPTCEFAAFEDMNPQCLIGQYDDEQYEEDEQAIFANLNNAPSITTSSIDIKLFGSIAAILLIFSACFVYYKRKNNNDEKAKYSSIDNLNYGTTFQQNTI
mmetsp:Transcript_48455/g.43427  ORF Transcript_48455/g.43427 Transcript_48455/m.43427 type:complete len:201 (-) Transcript_48455:190-792(-)